MNLAQFLKAGLADPCVKMHILNNQVWQLAYGYTHLETRTIDDFSETELLSLVKEQLLEFPYVGFTETFDSDAAVILTALGLPETKQMPRLNDSPDRPSVTSQPPTILSLLDELTILDRQLHSYAEARRPAAQISG